MSSGSVSRRRAAPAPAQLVERGVAGDAEQPGLHAPAPGSVARALAVGALEGLRRHVLRRRAVAQQRRHIRVDPRERPLVERGESLGVRSRYNRHALRDSFVHALTTNVRPVHHALSPAWFKPRPRRPIATFVSRPFAACGRDRVRVPARAALPARWRRTPRPRFRTLPCPSRSPRPAAPPSVIAGVAEVRFCGRRSTSATPSRRPNSMGMRASMPGNGTGQRMYMRFMAEYWSRALPGLGAGCRLGQVAVGIRRLGRVRAPPGGLDVCLRPATRGRDLHHARRASSSSGAPTTPAGQAGLKRQQGGHEKRPGRTSTSSPRGPRVAGGTLCYQDDRDGYQRECTAETPPARRKRSA